MVGKGGEEDREYDGRSALREVWKEWEENGEQQQKTDGVETVGGERSERKVRKGRKKGRQHDSSHGQPHPL